MVPDSSGIEEGRHVRMIEEVIPLSIRPYNPGDPFPRKHPSNEGPRIIPYDKPSEPSPAEPPPPPPDPPAADPGQGGDTLEPAEDA